MNPTLFMRDQTVFHEIYGVGKVLLDEDDVVLVRFDPGIQSVLKVTLQVRRSVQDRLNAEDWDVPLAVITRLQAETIRSINDVWGVFSPSRMELLPHQLWVCRQVMERLPARWLVADDVGLGKTVEAGMILSALFSRKPNARVLILCPASLKEQWQNRMLDMFDLRFTIYKSDEDTENEVDISNPRYWRLNSQVIASLQTMRIEQNGRRERLLNAAPWDMVIVDEAHHLNADEEAGQTLGYRLVRELNEAKRIQSLILFTGTPHRGKDFGFFALLHLLYSDIFDPRNPFDAQIAQLPMAMIRNNKNNVTDLQGNRLFLSPLIQSETYTYSPEEERFYLQMTSFIATGRAYANTLSEPRGRAVMLVLIAMQKLASSSVAAVKRALKRRLARIESGEIAGTAPRNGSALIQEEVWQDADEDARTVLEESLAETASSLQLMTDEAEAMRELIAVAEAVEKETRITALLRIVEERYAGRSVLFFTEYKATQALLMSALIAQYGENSVAFINGDERIEEVRLPSGEVATWAMRRQNAAIKFNAGRVRFLVSTEAAGEGIDLQESCFTLIHVDLPWNPMRLHQRVGRLNRYGQKLRVEVLSLRNPDTVESMIWDKLNEKLERISRAVGEVMDEPEDMLQLVLGMTSPTFLQELYSEGIVAGRSSVDQVFDAKTARFGGDDIVATVRALLGSVRRFDFQQVSSTLPRVDIPDLKPFFENALNLNGRRLRESTEGYAFTTPEAWTKEYGIDSEYVEMQFERSAVKKRLTNLLGVGHRIMDKALTEVLKRTDCTATLPAQSLPGTLVIVRVQDKVTGSDIPRRALLFGVQFNSTSSPMLMKDSELLLLLNELPVRRNAMTRESQRTIAFPLLEEQTVTAQALMEAEIPNIDHGFVAPALEVYAVLVCTMEEGTEGG